MTATSDARVRRVVVTDPVAAGTRYDYADAFELRLSEPDEYTTETWLRAGLEGVPGTVRTIVRLLGLHPAPKAAADQVAVFKVVASGPDLMQLEASVPLMHLVLVGRNVEPTRRVFTTILHYKRPVLARPAWLLVGIAHRRTAPLVLTRKM